MQEGLPILNQNQAKRREDRKNTSMGCHSHNGSDIATSSTNILFCKGGTIVFTRVCRAVELLSGATEGTLKDKHNDVGPHTVRLETWVITMVLVFGHRE